MSQQTTRLHDPVALCISGGDLRVRSVLVTVFEDLIRPHGGEIGIMALQRVFAVLGHEAGAVRTAVSRLTAEGVLERRRDGRASFYRLSAAQIAKNREGVRRVYAPVGRASGSNWLLVHLEDAEIAGHAARLRAAGFLSPARDIFIWPLSRPAPTDMLPRGAIVARGVLMLDASHRAALCPPGVVEGYCALIEDIAIARERLDREVLHPHRALAVRLLLIHRWQKLLLSHAELSREIEPDDWPGERARAEVAQLYRAMVRQSEDWLRNLVPELGGTTWCELPARF